MPRTYRQGRRAEAAAETRRRIIETTRRLLPTRSEMSVDEIAREAGVAVQTLYTHFGSKRGLLLAVIDSVQRDAGLYTGFDRVWASPDGETALRCMIHATFELWDGAWPFVEFTLRARRTDREVGDQLRAVDTMRKTHLWIICRRLAFEGRISSGRAPEWAADVAFTLSTPTVYEEFVRVGGWDLGAASEAASDAVAAVVIEPGTKPVPDPPAEWGGTAMTSFGAAEGEGR
jgi:AcrR family transcriptional regulator